MSIIADTLKRLQAQSTNQPAELQDDPPPRPTFNKGEGSGQHQKASTSTFWMMSAGIALALVGLVFGAFWVGWHMDFGLTTHTQATINNHPSAPNALQPKDPPTEDSSAKSAIAKIPENTRPLKNQEPEDLLPSAHPPSTLKVTTPTQSQKTDPHPISEEEIDKGISGNPVASLDSQNPQNYPSTNTKRHTAQEEHPIPLEKSPAELSSEEATTIPKMPTTTVPSLPSTASANMEEPAKTAVLAVALDEEEIIQPDDFVLTSILPNDSRETTDLESLPTNIKNKKPKTVSPPKKKDTPAQQLQQARQLIQEGQYEEASTLLTPLFHNPPVDWQPWFWMGTALLGKGEMEQADQFFLSGLARNDKVPQLWIQRALVAQQRENYQLAIHELRQAELLDGNLPHIPLNMGYAYEQLGNVRLANQYYGKFLKLSEGNPEFFPIRKKIFAHLTHSMSKKNSTPISDTTSPES